MTRQDAIKILIEYKDDSIERTIREWEEYDKKMYQAIDMAIDALKDRPTGKWIVSEGGNQWNEMDNLKCQNCGAKFKNVWDIELYNFCPNCGADMRKMEAVSHDRA